MNNALSERNERVKYARTLGIAKPHTLKKDALETAIHEAERAQEGVLIDDDPFDPIDPTLEGDALPDPETVAEALLMRDATREAWLNSAVEALRPLLAQAGATNINTRRIAASVGFPQGNARKIIGQCWAMDTSSTGAVNSVFISPVLDDALTVLGVVAHEMIHADDNGASKHAGHFRKVARALGLTGKITATEIGPDLEPVLKDMVAELGEYPHVKLNLGTRVVKKQSTRLLKAMCGEFDGPCPLADTNGKLYTIRLSKKWVEIGLPTCPCGSEMKLDETDGE